MFPLKKPIAKKTAKVLERRLPKGTLKFPAALKDPKAVDLAEIERVRKQFAVTDLFRVHGIAFKAGPKTRKPFKPSASKLTDLVWVQSPRERIIPKQVSGREISKITDAAIVEKLQKAGIKISVLESTAPKLLKKIEKKVFG